MRTAQRLTMTGILACTALVGAVAFVAWPDERPTAAVADDGAHAGNSPGSTASASGTPARSNRAEHAPAVRTIRTVRTVRTVRPRASHAPADIPTVQQPQGHLRSATSPTHPKQGSPTQQPPTHPKQGSPTQQPPPQPLPGPRFETVTSPDDDCDVAISPDGQALTVGLSAFVVKVSGDTAGTRHATKTVPVLLRMAEGTRQGRVRVYVQGYGFTEGAKGSLTISGGGQQVIQGFGDHSEGEFLQSLDFTAAPGSTVRVSIILDLQVLADSEGDTGGYMNVSAVDARFI